MKRWSYPCSSRAQATIIREQQERWAEILRDEAESAEELGERFIVNATILVFPAKLSTIPLDASRWFYQPGNVSAYDNIAKWSPIPIAEINHIHWYAAPCETDIQPDVEGSLIELLIQRQNAKQIKACDNTYRRIRPSQITVTQSAAQPADPERNAFVRILTGDG